MLPDDLPFQTPLGVPTKKRPAMERTLPCPSMGTIRCGSLYGRSNRSRSSLRVRPMENHRHLEACRAPRRNNRPNTPHRPGCETMGTESISIPAKTARTTQDPPLPVWHRAASERARPSNAMATHRADFANDLPCVKKLQCLGSDKANSRRRIRR